MNLPSGTSLKYDYDRAARITKISKATTGAAFSTSTTFWPQGAARDTQLGNGLFESTQYNSRLQGTAYNLGRVTGATDLWALTNDYTALGADKNNGNVTAQTLTVPGFSPVSTGCAYDELNRLAVAAEQTPGTAVTRACPDATAAWCQSFSYGPYGNRLVTARSGSGNGISPLEPPAYDSATNRISGTPWTYDYRGNITTDGLNRTATYDLENRMTSLAGVTYTYDGEGRRVKQSGVGGNVVYLYDVFGQLAAEYRDTNSARKGTLYLTTDHLGSTRVVTDGAGNVVEPRPLPLRRHHPRRLRSLAEYRPLLRREFRSPADHDG